MPRLHNAVEATLVQANNKLLAVTHEHNNGTLVANNVRHAEPRTLRRMALDVCPNVLAHIGRTNKYIMWTLCLKYNNQYLMRLSSVAR